MTLSSSCTWTGTRSPPPPPSPSWCSGGTTCWWTTRSSLTDSRQRSRRSSPDSGDIKNKMVVVNHGGRQSWWSSINAMMMVNLTMIIICWCRELLLQLSIIMVQRWNPSSNSNLISTCTWSRSWFQSRCNLFETGSASEWTLYISEWTSPPGGGLPLSNIRITTKVSFRRHNHQQHLK